MKINNKILLSLVLVFTLNCKKSKSTPIILENKVEKKEQEVIIDNDNISNEDFEKFLVRFINDSTFRYSRVNFPIKGFNSEVKENQDDYIWVKDDWDFYFEEDAKYKDNESIISETSSTGSIAIWRLYIKNSGYDIYYHFERKNKEWYLVKYFHQNI